MKEATDDSDVIGQYFLRHEEPARSCLLSLRYIVLHCAEEVTEVWRYSMPFYCYRGKRFCYLWTHKKLRMPYIGLVDGNKMRHKSLQQEQRSRMKILPIDPRKDIPIRTVRAVLKEALEVCGQQRVAKPRSAKKA